MIPRPSGRVVRDCLRYRPSTGCSTFFYRIVVRPPTGGRVTCTPPVCATVGDASGAPRSSIASSGCPVEASPRPRSVVVLLGLRPTIFTNTDTES